MRRLRRHKSCPSCGVLHGAREHVETYAFTPDVSILFVCQCGHQWWVLHRG